VFVTVKLLCGTWGRREMKIINEGNENDKSINNIVKHNICEDRKHKDMC
jgi:hypothetical protein